MEAVIMRQFQHYKLLSHIILSFMIEMKEATLEPNGVLDALVWVHISSFAAWLALLTICSVDFIKYLAKKRQQALSGRHQDAFQTNQVMYIVVSKLAQTVCGTSCSVFHVFALWQNATAEDFCISFFPVAGALYYVLATSANLFFLYCKNRKVQVGNPVTNVEKWLFSYRPVWPAS